MTLIRKAHAGNDSFGHTWAEDGSVVDVDPSHAALLMQIPDGGFSEVAPTPGYTKPRLPEPEPAKPEPAKPEAAKPEPAKPEAAADAGKPAAKAATRPAKK